MDGRRSGSGPATSNARHGLLAGFGIPAIRPGVLIIDLDALRAQLRKLRRLAAPAECAAVVKGDGYGLGARQVGDGASCRRVAGPSSWRRSAEADAACAALCRMRRSTSWTGCFPAARRISLRRGLRPVLGSIDEIEEWAALCRERQIQLPAAHSHRYGHEPPRTEGRGRGGRAGSAGHAEGFSRQRS